MGRTLTPKYTQSIALVGNTTHPTTNILHAPILPISALAHCPFQRRCLPFSFPWLFLGHSVAEPQPTHNPNVRVWETWLPVFLSLCCECRDTGNGDACWVHTTLDRSTLSSSWTVSATGSSIVTVALCALSSQVSLHSLKEWLLGRCISGVTQNNPVLLLLLFILPCFVIFSIQSTYPNSATETQRHEMT